MHHVVLVPRRHLPVDEPEPQIWQQLAETPELRFGAGSLDLLGVLHQRAHHERLTPLRHGFGHQLPDPGLLVASHRPGLDRAPSGGELVDDRLLEVPVQRHRQRPRDRRGQIGRGFTVTLLTQHVALLCPEAMLLVDDSHPERGELDRLLNQGVRPDDDVDVPLRQHLEDLRPTGTRIEVRRRLTAGQQRQPHRRLVGCLPEERVHPEGGVRADVRRGHVRLVEQVADPQEVLNGQHLGRRHHRRLVSTLDGDQQRCDGDDRLARADLALDQPLHRVGRHQIADDILDRPTLRAGQLIGQPGDEPLRELT